MLGMLLDSGNSHTLVEGNGYNTVLVTLIYSRVRNISSRCYGRDYEWRKLFGTTKSLREAETLVAQLTINDLITFCSSFGLESHGTQSQLEEHLLYYYATQIGRDKPPFLTPRVRKRKTFGSTIPSESNKIGSDSESERSETLTATSTPDLQHARFAWTNFTGGELINKVRNRVWICFISNYTEFYFPPPVHAWFIYNDTKCPVQI